MGPHSPLADFISLWVVVNPFAVLAIFVGVTGHGRCSAIRTGVSRFAEDGAIVIRI